MPRARARADRTPGLGGEWSRGGGRRDASRSGVGDMKGTCLLGPERPRAGLRGSLRGGRGSWEQGASRAGHARCPQGGRERGLAGSGGLLLRRVPAWRGRPRRAEVARTGALQAGRVLPARPRPPGVVPVAGPCPAPPPPRAGTEVGALPGRRRSAGACNALMACLYCASSEEPHVGPAEPSSRARSPPPARLQALSAKARGPPCQEPGKRAGGATGPPQRGVREGRREQPGLWGAAKGREPGDLRFPRMATPPPRAGRSTLGRIKGDLDIDLGGRGGETRYGARACHPLPSSYSKEQRQLHCLPAA